MKTTDGHPKSFARDVSTEELQLVGVPVITGYEIKIKRLDEIREKVAELNYGELFILPEFLCHAEVIEVFAASYKTANSICAW